MTHGRLSVGRIAFCRMTLGKMMLGRMTHRMKTLGSITHGRLIVGRMTFGGMTLPNLNDKIILRVTKSKKDHHIANLCQTLISPTTGFTDFKLVQISRQLLL